jgi:hypothetical protein
MERAVMVPAWSRTTLLRLVLSASCDDDNSSSTAHPTSCPHRTPPSIVMRCTMLFQHDASGGQGSPAHVASMTNRLATPRVPAAAHLSNAASISSFGR